MPSPSRAAAAAATSFSLFALLLGAALPSGGCFRREEDAAPAHDPAAHDPAGSDPTALEAPLAALGYVDTVDHDPDPATSGVIRHDPARAWPGINVYCSVRSREIHFVDMDGTVLHTLALPDAFDAHAVKEARLDRLPPTVPRALVEGLLALLGADCMAEPDGRGSLLVLTAPYLAALDLSGRLRWIDGDRHHHDFAQAPTGEVLTWSERQGSYSVGGRVVPIRDHALSLLRDGHPVRDLFTLGALLGGDWREAIDAIAEQEIRKADARGGPLLPIDAFHPNSVELLARDLPVQGGVAPRGAALICVRNLDLVAIVDLEAGTVVWSWGPGELDRPHQPSLLPDGSILVFDNGERRGFSRLVAVDPRTNRIVRDYRGAPGEPFYSKVRGAALPLPNGNVLVTESTRGRVFELDPDDEVVWEFLNPETEPENGARRQIYRAFRMSPAAWARLSRGLEPADAPTRPLPASATSSPRERS